MAKDGGPALPRPYSDRPRSTVTWSAQEGMSLRDWFAGAALIGMLAKGVSPEATDHGFAVAAWAIADIMLLHRSQKPPQ